MGIGVAAMSYSAEKIAKLRKLSASIRRLPKVVAVKVAQAVVPEINEAAQATFYAGQDAYGTPWKPGKHGQMITLIKSGALARGLRFVASGVRIRVRLGVKYAKFQIGKRPVFPRKGGALPESYVVALKAATASVAAAEVKS